MLILNLGHLLDTILLGRRGKGARNGSYILFFLVALTLFFLSVGEEREKSQAAFSPLVVMCFYIWNTWCINTLWLSQASLLKSRILPSALFRELGWSPAGGNWVVTLLPTYSGYVDGVTRGKAGWSSEPCSYSWVAGRGGSFTPFIPRWDSHLLWNLVKFFLDSVFLHPVSRVWMPCMLTKCMGRSGCCMGCLS